ncbi:hypothetical protein SAY86_021900 [Trapa natans]|uniref:Uncharacterized protein n=1 Tax=Trapa natans TaxID=22666 RepID=A0AAN7MZW8_TRANT|nr:hypothetical protein SAY86_021900 [Trapa natans]
MYTKEGIICDTISSNILQCFPFPPNKRHQIQEEYTGSILLLVHSIQLPGFQCLWIYTMLNPPFSDDHEEPNHRQFLLNTLMATSHFLYPHASSFLDQSIPYGVPQKYHSNSPISTNPPGISDGPAPSNPSPSEHYNMEHASGLQEAEDTSSSKKENARSSERQPMEGNQQNQSFIRKKYASVFLLPILATLRMHIRMIDFSIKYHSGQDAAEETSMAMYHNLSSLLINFLSAMLTPDWYLGGTDEVRTQQRSSDAAEDIGFFKLW